MKLRPDHDGDKADRKKMTEKKNALIDALARKVQRGAARRGVVWV